jgi:hypothetical protein
MLTPQQKKKLAAKSGKMVKALATEFYDRLVDIVSGDDLVGKFGLPQTTDKEWNQSEADILGAMIPIAIKAIKDVHSKTAP